MNSSEANKNFLRDTIIISAAVAAGAWFSANLFLKMDIPISFWITFAILVILSLAIHRFLVRSNEKRPQIFVANFMGSLAVKLFLSAILLVLVGVLDKSSLPFTAIGYLIGYFLFLIAEVRNLLPLIRSSSN
jgi:branched-subunit amino acid ABC-type transport system permease component